MKTQSPFRFSSLGLSVGIVALGFLLLCVQGNLAEATDLVTADYDAVQDFSISSNPNGVWSYGWTATLGSALNLYTVTDSTTFPGLSAWLETGNSMYAPPLVGHNDTSGQLCYLSFCVPPTYLQVHPGPNNEITVVRWTAPVSGNFFVKGKVVGEDKLGPTSTRFYLLRNSTSLLSINVFEYKSP